jgi:hypothetical protein
MDANSFARVWTLPAHAIVAALTLWAVLVGFTLARHAHVIDAAFVLCATHPSTADDAGFTACGALVAYAANLTHLTAHPLAVVAAVLGLGAADL